MIIKKVQLKNFLSFGVEEQSLEFGQINTIVGPNNTGKTNVFRAISFVGELFENQNSETAAYHHNGNLNHEFEIKIKVQFNEEEIDALSRFLVCSTIIDPGPPSEGEDQNAIRNLMKTLLPQNRNLFKKLFESVSLEVVGKGLETRPNEIKIRLTSGGSELFIHPYGIVTKDSISPSNIRTFNLSSILTEKARLKKPDEVTAFLSNRTTESPLIDLPDNSLFELIIKKLNENPQNSLSINGFGYQPVENVIGSLPDLILLRSYIRKRGNKKDSLALFEIISTFFRSSLVRISDIRNKPKSYLPVLPIELQDSEFSLITGTEIPLLLFKLNNSSNPKERRQYREIEEQFKEIYNGLEFDVIINRRIISEEGQEEFLKIPQQFDMGMRAATLGDYSLVGISQKRKESIVDELIIRIIKDDFVIPLDFAAAGITESLLLLVALIGHERKTILLDEPALNLHPNMQRRIFELLKKSVSMNHNEIILITHSPYMIDETRLQYTWRFVNREDATKIIHLGREIEEISKDFEEKTKLSLGKIETRSLLFCRGTVLVEGLSDKIVVEKIDKHLSLQGKGANLEDNEWVVTDVGGKGSIGKFISFCQRLEVPYKVIVDYDALMECDAKINTEHGEFKTSRIFLALHKNGLLEPREIDNLKKLESTLITKDQNKNSRSWYPEQCFSDLLKIAKKYRIFVFEKDLEGALQNSRTNRESKPLHALNKIEELIENNASWIISKNL
jgi:predicted ATP-dependent endonuclease of OLD family